MTLGDSDFILQMHLLTLISFTINRPEPSRRVISTQIKLF